MRAAIEITKRMLEKKPASKLIKVEMTTGNSFRFISWIVLDESKTGMGKVIKITKSRRENAAIPSQSNQCARMNLIAFSLIKKVEPLDLLNIERARLS